MSNIYTEANFAADMGVSTETLERFETWRRRLVEWNAKINLVGASTLDDFWLRHALDGAQLVPVLTQLQAQLGPSLASGTGPRAESGAESGAEFGTGSGIEAHPAPNTGPETGLKPGNDTVSRPGGTALRTADGRKPQAPLPTAFAVPNPPRPGATKSEQNCASRTEQNTNISALSPEYPQTITIIDIGSGAGIPGLPIAFMLMDAASPWANSGTHALTLIEPSTKRAAFLRQIIRETGAPAQVLCDKWENVPAQPAKIVTSRAFAPLPKLLAAADRFWGPDTLGLFLKGRGAEQEILSAQHGAQFDFSRHPSRSDPAAAVLAIKNLTCA